MTHILKILPEYYEAVILGAKTFEVRKDDRGYQIGDVLVLREWRNGKHTGRDVRVIVTYILRDSEYCKDGYCVIGIKKELDYVPLDYNRHTLRITLNYCGAVGHISFIRGGNCKGAYILDEALDFFEDCDTKDIERLVENDCELEMISVDDEVAFNVTLHEGNKNVIFEAIDEKGIQEMVVAAEIAACKGEVELEGV